jgi:anti-anti-sigma factor
MLNIHEPDPLSRTELSIAKVGPATIASLACPQLHEEQAEALEFSLRELVETSGGRLIVDMTAVANFSCAWINTLIVLTRACETRQGRLAVVGINHRHRRLLSETGLTRYLTLASTQHEALDLVGCPMISPWRLTIARMLNIPVAPTLYSKAA